MRTKRVIAVLLVVVSTPTLRSVAQEGSVVLGDQYEVYASLLRGPAPRYVSARTVPGDACIRPSGFYAKQVAEALSNRPSISSVPILNEHYFPDSAAVKVLTDEQMSQAKSYFGQAELRPKDVPAGITQFSPVGFSVDGTVAVLFMGYHCGLNCGTWASHALHREKGQWKEIKGQTACMAVS